MFKPPKTKAEADAHRFGKWSGFPTGYKFNPGCCAYEVGARCLFVQCSRKPGYGPDGLYCKQHAKKVRHG